MYGIDTAYYKNGINHLLSLVMITACLIVAGCAASSTDVSAGSAQSKEWHGLFIDDLVKKLPTPDSVTELPGAEKLIGGPEQKQLRLFRTPITSDLSRQPVFFR